MQATLGRKALRIEHIGSTSVPDLSAKPFIDIMVAVESLALGAELVPVIEALGYIYKPHDTIPERLFFARESFPEYRTHHLNLATFESGFWKNQILFRDYLSSHHQIATEYVELKERLAEAYAQTQVLDRDYKSAFVARVLALARQEESESD